MRIHLIKCWPIGPQLAGLPGKLGRGRLLVRRRTELDGAHRLRQLDKWRAITLFAVRTSWRLFFARLPSQMIHVHALCLRAGLLCAQILGRLDDEYLFGLQLSLYSTDVQLCGDRLTQELGQLPVLHGTAF